jgi:5-methylcytosine-specific restriction endonuclease McrA
MAREFSKKFYKSKEWKKCREYIFNKYHGLCQCGATGEEVHHKEFLTPDNISDPNITLGEDNLILLCKVCHHNKHHKKETTRDGLVFNEDGELVQL